MSLWLFGLCLIHLLCIIHIPYLIHLLYGDTDDTKLSNTGALLSFTTDNLINQTWEVAPSQFGYQAYGGKVEGFVILPANKTYHTECTAEPIGMNPYIEYITHTSVDPDKYILLIDRLDCYFTQKVTVAQTLTASAAIICDWKYENLFTMWTPQDFEDNINIPSVLLSRSDCEILMSAIGVLNWDPQSPETMVYPQPQNMSYTFAVIEWGLPHPDNVVNYELWTSSNDPLSAQFKYNFRNTAEQLIQDNKTNFTPHMYILNGSHWGCTDATLPCRYQCSNNGRYCSVDPEYDLNVGLNGIDVIQENVRSLCVKEYEKTSSVLMNEMLWWNYSILFDKNCGVFGNNSAKNFTEACSFQQMDALTTELNIRYAMWFPVVIFVQNCTVDSGGYGYTDGVNTILQRETRLRENSSIYAMPMIRVNEFLIHGNMICPSPVTVSTCAVLAAICAGFINGTQPDICYLKDNTCEQTGIGKDCDGVCFGTKVTDMCDNCLYKTSANWNACLGCDGIPYSEKYFDKCGECLLTTNESWNKCVEQPNDISTTVSAGTTKQMDSYGSEATLITGRVVVIIVLIAGFALLIVGVFLCRQKILKRKLKYVNSDFKEPLIAETAGNIQQTHDELDHISNVNRNKKHNDDDILQSINASNQTAMGSMISYHDNINVTLPSAPKISNVTDDGYNELIDYNDNTNIENNINYFIGQKLLIEVQKLLYVEGTIIDIMDNGQFIVVKYDNYNNQGTEKLHVINDQHRIKIVELIKSNSSDDIKNDENQYEDNENEESVIKNENEYNECVICMDKIPQYCCVPCGHYCLCKNCKDLIDKKCPICMAQSTVIKIFK